MPKPTSLFAGLAFLVVAASAGWAQNVGLANQRANQGGQGSLSFAGMAQEIFRQSDRNHNSILNRSEFGTAQMLTENTIANLGRSGLIGRGRALNLGQSLTGRHRQMRILGQAGGLGGIGVRNAGLGGLGGVNAGMLGTTITNTNHVTIPQFTNYFLNSVANADAALRNMYANMRRGYGRTYARYGRGYGHRPYYGYGHPGYAYNRPHSSSTSAASTGSTASTPSTTKGQTQAANSSATAGKSVLTGGGGGPINSAALGSAGQIIEPQFAGNAIGSTTTHHSHAAGQSNHRNSASSQPGSATVNSNASNANAAQIRARITAMAQARAMARNTAYSGGGGATNLSGGGGGAPMNFSGGGHPGGGGGHSGGGGQQHAGGGGGGHHGHR